MHNTDRTQLEFETGNDEFESHDFEFEFETEDKPCSCQQKESEILSDAEEMELAAELLEVNGEEELEQFLGKFIKRIGRKVRKFVKSPIGGALLKGLKHVAMSAVPGLGPVLGAASALGSAVKAVSSATQEPATPEDAGEIFGLELEGLSPEDQEFEVARRFVRLGAEAVVQAAAAPQSAPPDQAAQQAVHRAAQRHAPGLRRHQMQSRQAASSAARHTRSGRWERRGRHIVLFNV